MKYLLILLFSLSAFAEHKVMMTPTDTHYSSGSFIKNTEQLALNKLKNIILKSKWMKCDWQLDQEGTYAEKVFTETEMQEQEYQTNVLDENGEITLDENGDPITETLTGMFPVETEVTKYCKPNNFSVTVTDITQEMADKEAERLAAKAARQELRDLKQTINDSDLPNWHKKLLRYLIKEIRE